MTILCPIYRIYLKGRLFSQISWILISPTKFNLDKKQNKTKNKQTKKKLRIDRKINTFYKNFILIAKLNLRKVFEN